MNHLLNGGKRRYHIESTVSSDALGTVYKAFARHRSGRRIVRRYYAVVERDAAADVADFESSLLASTMAVPFDLFVDERFEQDGRNYVVVAKGVAPREPNRRWTALQNHGYLMLLLAGLIVILMIIRFFQSPSDTQEVFSDITIQPEILETE